MSPVQVEPWEDGAAFQVKAHASARRDALVGAHDGMLKVEVTAAPDKGKANKAIGKFLAKRLGIGASAVVLLAGETNPKKRFAVRGMKPEILAAKLTALLAKDELP